MGYKRTFTTWLIVLGLSLAPLATQAQDVGPGREVRAIRHDLPIIMTGLIPSRLQVDAVVVAGSNALVQAHAYDATLVIVLSRRLQTWWFENDAYILANGEASSCWTYPRADNTGVTPDFLRLLGVPQQLIDLATERLPLAIDGSRPAASTPPPNAVVKPGINVECIPRTDWIAVVRSEQTVITTQNYSMHIRLGTSDATSTVRLDISGRSPTEGESWLTRNENSYFFFTATVSSPSIVHIDRGTTIDVWFPFALDPSKTYSLTIAHTDPTIGPVNATLKDNTLHFVLPAFAVEPGIEIMGEIEGDPPQ